ncbi:MAG: shikimate dehydrogenase [Caulobacteraceae bacterium]|nr:shikimate dehydrogenase [Caulobacteraceae bacterium]
MSRITGATAVAGVVGRPVRHSMSPILHNAWLAATGIDGVYVPFSPTAEGFPALVAGLRGASVRGLNVTLPFKEAALAAADRASERALRAGAANVLVFEADGTVRADNTDGEGMIGAFAAQAPGHDLAAAPVVVLGAGGAGRGAVGALLDAGAPEVRLVNRTLAKAEAIKDRLGGPIRVFGWDAVAEATSGAGALVNATALGLEGRDPPLAALEGLPPGAVVMDMVYKPLRTALLAQAAAAGHPTVDGLEMLIRQAVPSFEAFFGQAPPASVDVRALALAALGEAAKETVR